MNLVRLAALGVLAGVAVSAPARAAGGSKDDPTPGPIVQNNDNDDVTPPEKEPADEVPTVTPTTTDDVTVVDPTPVADVPTISPATTDDVTVVDPTPVADVPTAKAVEPATPGPVTPDVKTSRAQPRLT